MGEEDMETLDGWVRHCVLCRGQVIRGVGWRITVQYSSSQWQTRSTWSNAERSLHWCTVLEFILPNWTWYLLWLELVHNPSVPAYWNPLNDYCMKNMTGKQEKKQGQVSNLEKKGRKCTFADMYCMKKMAGKQERTTRPKINREKKGRNAHLWAPTKWVHTVPRPARITPGTVPCSGLRRPAGGHTRQDRVSHAWNSQSDGSATNIFWTRVNNLKMVLVTASAEGCNKNVKSILACKHVTVISRDIRRAHE